MFWQTEQQLCLSFFLTGIFSGSGRVLNVQKDSPIIIAHLTNSMDPEIAKLIVSSAIERLYNQSIIPETIKFRHILINESCDVINAVAVALKYHFANTPTDVWLGPTCNSGMAQLSVLAAVWENLVLGYLSSGNTLANKDLYKYLVRFHPPQNQLINALVAVIQSYGWRQVAVIQLDGRPACSLVNAALDALLGIRDVSVNYFNRIDRSLSVNDISYMLEEIRSKARSFLHYSYHFANAFVVIVMCNGFKDVHYPEYRIGSRDVLLEAMKMGMVTPEYVYLLLQPGNHYGKSPPWEIQNSVDPDDDLPRARMSFKSAIIIKPEGASEMNFVEIDKLTRTHMGRSIYDLNDVMIGSRNQYIFPMTYMYDSIYLYGLALNHSLSSNNTSISINGPQLIDFFRCSKFDGYSGTVALDRVADRIPSYALESFDFDDLYSSLGLMQGFFWDCFQATGDIQFKFKPYREARWDTADNEPPPDEPICGFTGTEPSCVVNIDRAIYITWRNCIHGCLSSNTWVQLEKFRSMQSIRSIQSVVSLGKKSKNDVQFTDRNFDDNYVDEVEAKHKDKGSVKLTIYRKNTAEVSLKREQLVMLRSLQNVHNENVCKFIGLSIDHPKSIVFVWAYTDKGTLEDLIFSTDIRLDSVFKTSIIRDIFKGVEYLHGSTIKYHGLLNASNCVVNSRWVVKLQNFGINQIAQYMMEKEQIHDYMPVEPKHMFHMSPEVLECFIQKQWPSLSIDMMQATDVYSCAMILYQVITRESLFSTVSGETGEILSKIVDKAVALRPNFRLHDISTEENRLQPLVKQMWHHDYTFRPTIQKARSRFVGQMKRYMTNIMDHMITMMENYTNNLEDLVKERTLQVEEEHQRSEELLCQLLPPSIATSLKNGMTINPENYESATIFFSDIVGFTTTCSTSTPLQVVTMINTLFSTIDQVISKHDVYKVETIGDSYLVASGLPIRNDDRHVIEIGKMACAMRLAIFNYKVPHLPDRQLRMRFGIHSGSVAAGVVGSVMPRYCLFGDTVNLASRMESSGEPMKIQITTNTKQLIENSNNAIFILTYRGEVQIKGKGLLHTYWLNTNAVCGSQLMK